MNFLILQFDAPMMSFGSTAVDNLGFTQDFPGLSLVTGLIANALGYEHKDSLKIKQLQDRILYAARGDILGELLQDFQTVNLGAKHMLASQVGWTTRGQVATRAGASGTGTHIRYRDYWSGAFFTLALGLKGSEWTPTLEDIELALKEPARPLFLGRKCCLPSRPIFQGRVEAKSAIEALVKMGFESLGKRKPKDSNSVYVWFPQEEEPPPSLNMQNLREIQVADIRDWENQIHTSYRLVKQGIYKISGGA